MYSQISLSAGEKNSTAQPTKMTGSSRLVAGLTHEMQYWKDFEHLNFLHAPSFEV
jgi:hypothetical protein